MNADHLPTERLRSSALVEALAAFAVALPNVGAVTRLSNLPLTANKRPTALRMICVVSAWRHAGRAPFRTSSIFTPSDSLS